jgi:hypothetical protein
LVGVVVLALLAAVIAAPVARAAGPFTVTPDTVSNANSTTLVIQRAEGGFTEGSVVAVDNVGALATEYVSPSVLTAVLPAGSPAGTFDVTVVLTNSSSLTLPNGLTIVGPTSTPEPTHTPAPTAFGRPLLVVQSYGASSPELWPGSDIDFEITFVNQGQVRAINAVASFTTGDLIPRVTGGVRALGALDPGGTSRNFQPFTVNPELTGKQVATLEVNVSYNDIAGQPYTDKFTLTFPVAQPVVGVPGPTRTPTPTATTRTVLRPQLLISAYTTDLDKLQPGARFVLTLDVQNLGSADARRVTMIAGGGSASSAPDPDGTPGAGGGGGGGVSGSGGDFTNFAPVGSSNVQSLGDLGAGDTLEANQTFVVNASTNPGAYPMKFSFVYAAEDGSSYTDDQVITLLVYRPPQVDVSFYTEVGPQFAGQPGLLPIQIVNLGRNSAVLGNMRVTAPDADLVNNVILVGALDPGGFFTLDSTIIPFVPGDLQLEVAVDYTDDFNAPQTITKTLMVTVLDPGPIIPVDPGEGEVPIDPPVEEPESLWDRVVRFIRGLLGLDSGQPPDGGEGVPIDGEPIDPGEGGPVEGPIEEATPIPRPRG